MNRRSRACLENTNHEMDTPVLAAIKRTFRELGPLDAVLYYLSEVMLRASGRRARIVRYCLVAQPVPESPLLSRPDANTLIRRILSGDPLISAFPRAPEIIDMRLARGDICLAATVKGQFAGFLWIAFNAYDEDEVRCRYDLVGKDISWDYDVHVEPAFRLGRTFLRLWDAANELLRDNGIRWSISRISAFNTTSLNSHARLGTRLLGKASFVVLGPLQLSFTKNWLPHFSLRDPSRPKLKLQAPPISQFALSNEK